MHMYLHILPPIFYPKAEMMGLPPSHKQIHMYVYTNLHSYVHTHAYTQFASCEFEIDQ